MYELPSPTADILLEKAGPLTFLQLGQNSIPQFLDFVFESFRTRLGARLSLTVCDKDYLDFLREEKAYDGNGMYAGILEADTQKMVGAFRTIPYDSRYEYPVEHVFGISVPALAAQLGVAPAGLWHGGCFAMNIRWLIRNGIRPGDVLRRIYFHSLAALLHNGATHVFGETDELIERLHARNGLTWRPISGWADYWGQTRVTLLDVAEAAVGVNYRDELRRKGFAD